MRGGDDDTVPVDLIEVDSPDALLSTDEPGGEPVGGLHGSDAEPGRRRRRRMQVGVGVAVVLGLAGTGVALSVLDDRRADARWDALTAGGLPLVHLGSPLTEAWRLDGGGYPMSASGDVMVVQAWDPTGMSNPWRGVDLATGEVVWERTDLGAGWCAAWNPAWSEDSSDVGTVRSVLGVTGGDLVPPTLLVCADAGFSGQVPAPGATATVHVIEIGTGRDTGSVVVDGAVLTFDPAGDDLVVSSVQADGTVGLARVPLDGGAVRWEVDTEVAAVDADGIYVGPYPQVVDGVLYLIPQEGGVVEAVSVETGEPVPGASDPPALSAGRMVLPDGSTVETFYPGMFYTGGSEGSDEPTVTVRGPDGEERFTVEGELWSPVFTDGSMADRMVVTRYGQGESSLVALDVETGEELWASRAPWSATMLQVDGVVVTGSGYLSAIDLRTGERIWEHQTGADIGVAPVTDGARILVPVAEGGAMSLAAIDIRTGTEAWRVPTVSGLQMLVPVDGGVLVGTDSSFLMYR